MSNETLPVTIFAGSATEAAMVRALLESSGIASYLDDEHLGTMAPHIASGGGAGAVKVMVSSEEAARAKELLAKRTRNT